MHKIKYSKLAAKDAEKLKASGLDAKAKKLISVLAEDPFKNPPPYEKLVGDLKGFYSRRINIQHRLVYKVDTEENTVYVYRMWNHYE